MSEDRSAILQRRARFLLAAAATAGIGACDRGSNNLPASTTPVASASVSAAPEASSAPAAASSAPEPPSPPASASAAPSASAPVAKPRPTPQPAICLSKPYKPKPRMCLSMLDEQ